MGEIADPNSRAIVSGPFGSNIGSRFFVDSGIPVIRGNNLTTDTTRFVDSGFVFITEEKAKEFRNCEAVSDDLVFTAAGTLGQVGIIPRSCQYSRYIISNKQLRARVESARVDPLFVYYWLSSKEMVSYIQKRNTGSSVPLINLSVLRSLPIPLPPLPEQRGIANILGSLDDKIEMNRQMSETLEAMARALFKSWFVDFDPVRAKIEGRWRKGESLPGLPADLWEAFPDRMVDSELGEIPEGWEVKSAGNLFEVAIGKTPPRKEHLCFSHDPHDLPWMSIKDLGQAGVFISRVSEYLTPVAVERYRVRRIPNGVVVLSFKLTVGRVAITDGEMLSNEAIAHFLPYRETYLDSSYLYCYLHQFDLNSLGSTSSIATAVNSDSIRAIPILIPSREVHSGFVRAVWSSFLRLREHERESRTLSSLQDTLLPKLISGEIRVKDADKFVERAI